MSGEESWFHCGRCGHLYGGDEAELCPSCGKPPVVAEAELAYVMAGTGHRDGSRRSSGSGSVHARPETAGDPRRRHRPRPGALGWFALGWLGLLGLIAGGVALMKSNAPAEVAEESLGIWDSSEQMRMLSEAFLKCRAELVGYWSAVSPESRAIHALEPSRTLTRLVESGSSLAGIDDPETLAMETFELIETGAGEAIASVWQSPDLGRIEAVFRRDDEGEWKLDWEHMSRYSTTSWSIFLSGGGPSSGEFRLYARRRTALGGGTGDGSSLIFVGPADHGTLQSGVQSPEVSIDPDSPMAKSFAAAFGLRDEGKGVFGTRFAENDPLGMIRVRVKLTRGRKNELGRYEVKLDEVLAFHWMEIDDPGVKPLE